MSPVYLLELTGVVVAVAMGWVVYRRQKRVQQVAQSFSVQEHALITNIISVAAEFIKLDGVIDDREVEQVEQFLDDVTLFSGYSKKWVLQLFRTELKKPQGDFSFTPDFKKLFSYNYRIKVFLIDLLCDLAIADGDFHPDEKSFIKKTAEDLSVKNEDVQTQFVRAQSQLESQSSTDLKYGVLGLAPDASIEQVNRAYLTLVRQYLPDGFQKYSKGFQSLNQRKLMQVEEAFEFINPTASGIEENELLRLSYNYKVFISYRHADNKEPDRCWADWIRRSLLNEKIPAEIVGRKNIRGNAVPESFHPVFMDEIGLSVGGDLNDSLKCKLEHSDTLIVICSPRTPESVYVEQEVACFKELGRKDRIFPVMIEGDANSFDAAQECLPAGLRCCNQPSEDACDEGRKKTIERLCADFRLIKGSETNQGYTNPSAYYDYLIQEGYTTKHARKLQKEYQIRHHQSWAKLVSGLLGVEPEKYTDACDRQSEKSVQRKLHVAVIAGVVLAIFALTGFGLFFSTQRAKEAAILSSYLADITLAHDHWKSGDLITAKNIMKHNEAKVSGRLCQSFEWRYLKQMIEGSPQLTQHEGPIRSMAFSHEGSLLASGGYDGLVCLWDLNKFHSAPQVITNKTAVFALDFSRDDQLLAIAGSGSTLRIIHTDNLQNQCLAEHKHQVATCLDFSPKNPFLLATGGDDASVVLWEIKDGEIQERCTATNLGNNVHGISFSPKGTHLAAGDKNGNIHLWEVTADFGLHLINKLEPPGNTNNIAFEEEIYPVTFSPDGTWLVSGWGSQNQHEIHLWSAWDTPNPILSVRLHDTNSARIYGLNFLNGEQNLLSTDESGLLTLWDLQAGCSIQQVDVTEGSLFSVVSRANIARTDNVIAVAGSSCVIHLFQFDSKTNRLIPISQKQEDGNLIQEVILGTHQTVGVNAHANGVRKTLVLPNKNCVVSAGNDGMVKFWNAETWQLCRPDISWKPPTGTVPANNLAINREGNLLAVSYGDWTATKPGHILLYDLNNNSTVGVITNAHSGCVNDIAFHPDGKQLISVGHDHKIKAWNLHPFSKPAKRIITGPDGKDPHSHWVWAVAFEPQTRTMITVGHDNKIHLWDMDTFKYKRTLEKHTVGIKSLAVHPKKAIIATGGFDNMIRLWDLKTGENKKLFGHVGTVSSLAFSPCGRTLVSGAWDGSIRLWNVKTGRELLQFRTLSHSRNSSVIDGLISRPNDVCFLPEQSSLLSSDDSGYISIWKAQTPHEE